MRFGILRWAALPALLLVVAGCIVVRPYDGPQTASIAYLNVQADTPTPPSVWIYRDAENCVSRYAMQGAAHLGTTDVSLSFAKIDADRAQSIAVISSAVDERGTKTCFPVLSFVPRAGRYYRIVMTTTSERCYASLASADNPDFRNAQKETYRKMIYSNGLDENSAFCRPAGPGE
jgi:hypothetical protein